ncbi:DNA cytosine methyltransferase [Arsenicibacter rosenii]|uniref:Cytosine-specific methyltransferase n=1 Tax=Arsenicibacter rosenii TaxID=1750698 RepID=A0A1S2VLM1_9BACT|nr:DNA cytosine methyltransferase [Arsenicibacter rosenii]OIN59125.1 DNA (cytosine-5-)-methyltransferase [Arsenicibacter rosenii]
MNKLTSLEVCAGAGGQALGLEQAGFDHVALVEIEPLACATLRLNRPEWEVFNQDLKTFDATPYKGKVDLLAGGVPCPPFSVAGKQLGELDERDLFPEAIRIAAECEPKAIMLENVRGLLDPKFKLYRRHILSELRKLGFFCEWRLLQASDFGVSQLRPRAILVGLKEPYYPYFQWPAIGLIKPKTIGALLYEEMKANDWGMVDEWSKEADGIAPTLVGGSKKHGGADLGPTRAKKAWATLGVDGKGLADTAPVQDFRGMPRLTLKMTALVQGFPKEWQFAGKKTPAYRQVGNAFPPPVAKALGEAIHQAINYTENGQNTRIQRKAESLFIE